MPRQRKHPKVKKLFEKSTKALPCFCLETFFVSYIITLSSLMLIVSTAFIVLGSLNLANAWSFSQVVPDWVFIASILIGVVLFAHAVLGCVGSCNEMRYVEFTYAVISILLTCLFLAIGFLNYTYPQDTAGVKSEMKSWINQTQSDGDLLDFMNCTYSICCGLDQKRCGSSADDIGELQQTEENIMGQICKILPSKFRDKGSDACANDEDFVTLVFKWFVSSFPTVGTVCLTVAGVLFLSFLGGLVDCCMYERGHTYQKIEISPMIREDEWGMLVKKPKKVKKKYRKKK